MYNYKTQEVRRGSVGTTQSGATVESTPEIINPSNPPINMLEVFDQMAAEQSKTTEISAEKEEKMPIMPIMPIMPSFLSEENNTETELFHDEETDEETEEIEEIEQSLPVFINNIFDGLPFWLKRIVEIKDKPRERERMLVGALTLASTMLPHVHAVYNKRRMQPNLYACLVGPPGSGKGDISSLPVLVEERQKELAHDYEQAKAKYDLQQKRLSQAKNQKKTDATASTTEDEELLPMPIRQMAIIPGNNSTAGIYQTLNANGGSGLIFEPEMNTIISTMKQDYGDFSEALCKMFHGEPMTMHRKTDDAYINIQNPHAGMLLSGTWPQFREFFAKLESGFFSRFITYVCPGNGGWQDVGITVGELTDEERLVPLGKMLHILHTSLSQLSTDIEFTLTEEQLLFFNEFFRRIERTYVPTMGENVKASVLRYGHIFTRIALILSVLRLMEADDNEPLPAVIRCSNQDFATTTQIVMGLLRHLSYCFTVLQPNPEPKPRERSPFSSKQRENIYRELPNEFDHNDFLAIAQRHGVQSLSTADKMLNSFCKTLLLDRLRRNHYIKTR